MSNFPDMVTEYGGVPIGGLALMGAGNVYFVVQSGHTAYSYFKDRFEGRRYQNDNSALLHNTITTALTATVSGRNDYVIVMPDSNDYDEGATLTMNKDYVHLICPAGLGSTYGASTRAATIDPNAAAHAITITGRGCEVAGFWIRGYAEKYCVQVSGNGCWIHHNHCAITNTSTTGSAAGGIDVTSSGYEARVESNYIFSNAGNDATIAFGIQISASASRSQVLGNYIAVFNGNTMSNGIKMNDGCAMYVCDNNVLCESTAGGGVTAGTLSIGIYGGDSGLVTRNLIGIATENNAVNGGTADQTYVINYEASGGGTAAT